ncbi:MAG: YggS family pyridoxal phosphate-dependent enzyme [Treponema sp.]|jgi:pyridoxal phosphate enzyme (YggS family)|nr:YggS family pyridoxal phosphate-dependent enzyme [Treponema sp.]
MMNGNQAMNTGIADRIEGIGERIEKACDRAGRKRSEVSLMAVSKFHEAGEILEALNAGVRLFGENRVQEAERKFPPLRKEGAFALHMIGSLQRNKAKNALEVFDAVQSLDRDGLIVTLGKLCAERNKTIPVLLELHTGEESKSGYPDEESLFRAAEIICGFPALRLEGLMTMAPCTEAEEPVRRSFRALVKARAALKARFPELSLDTLSMGMTNDFEAAIEEGSTLVRIGTAIFGERK